MKSRIRLISIVAGAAVLLAMIVLLIAHAVRSNGSAAVPITPQEALEYYENAKNNFLSAEDYCLTIKSVKNTSVDDNVYSVTKDQTLTYRDFGSENMQALLNETMTIGNKQTEITQVYANNTAYLTVNGASFFGDMTADDFVGANIPVVAVDIARYDSVTADKSRDGVYIRLEQPKEPEKWSLPQGAQMRAASGAVLLDSHGDLKKTSYNIEYQYGAAVVNLTVTVNIDVLSEPEITIPDKTQFTQISFLETPRILETVYGYLLQSNSISAQATESINCQASGIKRVQTTALSMEDATTNLTAAFDSGIAIVDYSNGDETTNYTQLETFRDGVYSISNDGGKTSQQNAVTSQQMLGYCQDYLVKNVILPEYISAVTVTEQADTYTLEITASEALAKVICQNVCKTLYDDPELLNNLATSYKTQKITCYYIFDKYSELPTAAGLDYTGEHTIEGFAYTLSYLAEIVYNTKETVQAPVVDSDT